MFLDEWVIGEDFRTGRGGLSIAAPAAVEIGGNPPMDSPYPILIFAKAVPVFNRRDGTHLTLVYGLAPLLQLTKQDHDENNPHSGEQSGYPYDFTGDSQSLL